MAESWEYTLAKEFQKRDNPTNTPLGAVMGTVLSTSPPKISIQNGAFIIDSDKLYICNQILERETTYKNHTGQYNESGNASISCHPCSGNFTSSGTITSTGKIHLDEVWKVGDLVLVIPSESEQQFFVVDILRKVNGANESID